MAGLEGSADLQKKLIALQNGTANERILRLLGNEVVSRAKQNVPQKTRNLHRTIRVDEVDERTQTVRVVAGSTNGKVGYAQYVEVMTGKGYSRLKPCQTGLCATCQDYGRENFEALKAWGTDVRKFCEGIKLELPEMFAEKCFNETVDKVRHYLRDTFRHSCSSEAECQCATHSLHYLLLIRTRRAPFT